MVGSKAGLIGFALALLLALVPASARAQGSEIAGVVRDSTGAVLPGVSVEASSPALIEKVRTAVTDAQGLYKVIDLRPGTYLVTFTLPGFSTVRREGIELTASFTATVNAELRVSGVEETLTVTGAVPTVDIQNVSQQKVMTRAVVDALPTGTMSWQNLGVLIPGVVTQSQDVGGTAAVYVNIAAHGGRTTDIQMMTGGMSTSLGSARFSNGPRLNNSAAIQEFSIATGAHSAESVTGGVRIDTIYKDGGNRFSGSFYSAFANHGLQSDNLGDDLRARGLTTVDRVEKIFDLNPGFGGPIRPDSLWFYTAFKRSGQYTRIAGMFANRSTSPYAYTPDEERPAVERQKDGGRHLRLTWQATPRNKISFQYWDTQGPTNAWYGAGGAARLTAPEAISRRVLKPYYADQVNWTAPLTNRLLVEAGATFVNGDFQVFTQPGVSLDTPAITELRTGITWGNFSNQYGHNASHNFNERVVMSYVTGSHAFKAGLQLDHQSTYATQHVTGDSMTLQLLDGVPSRVTVFATPIERRERTKGAYALFVQDQWRVNRLTLNLGARFDHWNAYAPAMTVPAGRFVPERSYPAVHGIPRTNDFSPRLGIAWDLFGDSRTALKVNVARYLADASLTGLTRQASPVSGTVASATRTWNDANGDFIPQEQELGPLSDRNFGQSVITTRYENDALTNRFANWEVEAAVEREIVGRVSASVAYFRRWYQNFTTTDNLLTTPADFDPFCVTAPLDSRLPDGGGYQVCGLYDVRPALQGRFDNVITLSENFGTQREIFDGVDVNVNARVASGAVLSGGVSFGRTKLDSCLVVDSPQSAHPFVCRSDPPYRPHIKLLGIYPIPWLGLQASATFQSLPGPEILANHRVTSATIAPSLGRHLAAGANSTVLVPVVAPGTLFGERLYQIDLRVTKTARLAQIRIQPQVEVFNVFNANTILSHNNNYSAGPTGWLRPTQILQGRLLRFGLQMHF